jgi:hypothetical protein
VPQPPERRSLAPRVDDARIIAVCAVVVAALLALVALASQGAVGGGRSAGGGWSVPTAEIYSWVFAVVVVLGCIAAPLLAVIYTRDGAAFGRARKRLRVSTYVFLVVAAVLLAYAVRNVEEIAALLERLKLFDRDETGGGGREPLQAEFDWTPMVVVSSLAAVGVGALLARGVVGRKARPRPRTLAEELSAALDSSLDDLRSEPDARRAIIAAYARMEAACECCGVGRRESEAPLEYLARVLIELEVSEPPVLALTELFERAKFSHHPLAPELKEQAVDALEEIRGELRERG